MITPITYNNFLQSKSAHNTSFGSTKFVYKYANNKTMKCFSNVFRLDLNWEDLIKFLAKNFKNKKTINVINGACSDGSESFSLVMALKEFLPEKDYRKFLPIKAFDFNEDIIKKAKSGFLDISDTDKAKINKYITDKSTYFDENIDSFINSDEYQKLKLKKELTNCVDFEVNDIFKVLENLTDDSNTILLFRNALIHLGDDNAKKFASLASEKLKPNSIVIIGNTDVASTKIKQYMTEEGFTEVIKNVYRKNNPSDKTINWLKRLFNI